MANSSLKLISIFILAGGKSSRMGTEKGLVLFRGKPMIKHLLDVLSQLECELGIIGHHMDYHDFGVPVYSDLIAEKGPLGGIYTALSNCRTSHALILSCDAPLITVETLKKFIEQAGYGLSVGVFEGRVNPFPGLYPKIILPDLINNLEQNKLRVQGFVSENNPQLISMETISVNPIHEFTNFNSPSDFLLFEEKEKIKKTK